MEQVRNHESETCEEPERDRCNVQAHGSAPRWTAPLTRRAAASRRRTRAETNASVKTGRRNTARETPPRKRHTRTQRETGAGRAPRPRRAGAPRAAAAASPVTRAASAASPRAPASNGCSSFSTTTTSRLTTAAMPRSARAAARRRRWRPR
jgi:hypothetical protein